MNITFRFTKSRWIQHQTCMVYPWCAHVLQCLARIYWAWTLRVVVSCPAVYSWGLGFRYPDWDILCIFCHARQMPPLLSQNISHILVTILLSIPWCTFCYWEHRSKIKKVKLLLCLTSTKRWRRMENRSITPHILRFGTRFWLIYLRGNSRPRGIPRKRHVRFEFPTLWLQILHFDSWRVQNFSPRTSWSEKLQAHPASYERVGETRG